MRASTGFLKMIQPLTTLIDGKKQSPTKKESDDEVPWDVTDVPRTLYAVASVCRAALRMSPSRSTVNPAIDCKAFVEPIICLAGNQDQ